MGSTLISDVRTFQLVHNLSTVRSMSIEHWTFNTKHVNWQYIDKKSHIFNSHIKSFRFILVFDDHCSFENHFSAMIWRFNSCKVYTKKANLFNQQQKKIVNFVYMWIWFNQACKSVYGAVKKKNSVLRFGVPAVHKKLYWFLQSTVHLKIALAKCVDNHKKK